MKEAGKIHHFRMREVFKRKKNEKLIIYLPQWEIVEAQNVGTAFHANFAFRRYESQKELTRLRQFGWRSLLIAFVFLAIMMLLVQIIIRFQPVRNLSSVLQEGLTILAWVALWRPGEPLLYEWYPFYRDAKLFGKLEHAEVQVIAERRETRR